jgi:hypothetical protein
MSPSDLQTNEANKETTLALRGLEDTWNFEDGHSIAKNIALFLSTEDLLHLEQTSKTLQKHLTAEDTIGIWRNTLARNVILGSGGQRDLWSPPTMWKPSDGRGYKALALHFLKADTFAKACERQVNDERDLQEHMGREVAYEIFGLPNLHGPKAGYNNIFVRATTIGTKTKGDDSRHEQQRQVIVCGFPCRMVVAGNKFTFPLGGTGEFPELRELADLLNQENGFNRLVRPVIINPPLPGGENEPKWLAFLRAINLTILATHKNCRHRLIRATRGLSTNLAVSYGQPSRQEGHTFFATESASSNDEFQLPVMNETPDRRCVLGCNLCFAHNKNIVSGNMLFVIFFFQDASYYRSHSRSLFGAVG